MQNEIFKIAVNHFRLAASKLPELKGRRTYNVGRATGSILANEIAGENLIRLLCKNANVWDTSTFVRIARWQAFGKSLVDSDVSLLTDIGVNL